MFQSFFLFQAFQDMLFSNFRAFWKKWCPNNGISLWVGLHTCVLNPENFFRWMLVRNKWNFMIFAKIPYPEGFFPEAKILCFENFQQILSCQKKYSNFFSQTWKTDFLPLIFFSQNASFLPENALEIWEQKVTKLCSEKIQKNCHQKVTKLFSKNITIQNTPILVFLGISKFSIAVFFCHFWFFTKKKFFFPGQTNFCFSKTNSRFISQIQQKCLTHFGRGGV